MNDKTKYSTLERIFLVMVVTSFIPHGHAVDAAHARNAALFRLAVVSLGLVGYVVVQILKRRVPAQAVPGAPGVDTQSAGLPADGSPQIAVTYSSTRADQWRCSNHMLFRRPQAALALYAFPLVMIALIAGPLVGAQPARALALTFAVFGGWTAFLLLVTWVQILQRLPRRDSTRVCTTALRPDGFYDVTPDKTTFVAWSGIKSVQEIDGDVLFWRGVAEGSFVPRTAFRDRRQAHEYVQTAIALCKGQPIQWPADAVTSTASTPIADETVWPPPPQRF